MDDQDTPLVAKSPDVTAGEDPGRKLAIIGLVFSFFIALLGLIICIIARNKSAKAGHKNVIANIGIVVAIANMALGVYISIAVK